MRRPTGPSIAPIFLRIALGVTFIWAGLGKLEGEMRVSGEPAAILANMGLHIARKNAQPVPSEPAANVASPAPAAPVTPPATIPAEPAANPDTPGTTVPQPGTSQPPAGQSVPQPVMPEGQAPEQSAPSAPTQVAPPSILPPANAVRTYTAAEFPKEFEVKRVYGLALMLHRAAHPAPRVDGSEPPTLWLKRFARGTWPLFFAWSVAVVEVAGGICVLVGLLTRASAMGLAGVMIGAIWLTEVGPAVQAGTTVLGFIPDRDWLAVDQWKTVFWQFSLTMGAMALAFLGSGAFGFDRKLFPPVPPPPSNVKPMI